MNELLNGLNIIASIFSIVGLFVSFFLLYKVKEIQNSYLRRARLPDIIKALEEILPDLSSGLTSWETDKTAAKESFSKIKALLENVSPRLPSTQKKKVNVYLNCLKPKQFYVFKKSLSTLDLDAAWDLYTELNGLIVTLKQLLNDGKWD